MKTTINQKQFELVEGDITRMDTNAIVNATFVRSQDTIEHGLKVRTTVIFSKK